MQAHLPEIVTSHAVKDILNESFHEHRPSFKSLNFDKGSFSIASSNRSIHKILKKNKSNKTSFVSSISTDLGFISEDDDGDERDSNDDDDEYNYGASKESLLTESDILQSQMLLQQPGLVMEEGDDDGESVSTASPTNAGGKNFMDLFVLGQELGSGAYAVVKEGTHKATKMSYAIKIVDVANMDEFDLDALEIEISVMSRLCHPNIVRLYNTYKAADFYYLVTEKMVGGELLDRIVQKTFYNEKEARDTCKILFEAMHYCHERNIAHRDLKPENLLLTSHENDSDLKIADFGFAKKVPSTGLRTMCGTPGYVAPEILERVPYNTQCDLWSLGVIVYILLGGYSPFEEQSQEVLFKKIRAGNYVFHEEFWGPVSDDAKDLIRKLLNINPKKRLTAATALQHPWMTMSDDWLMNQDLGVNLTGLKRFNAKRKLKAAVKTVIATQKILALF